MRYTILLICFLMASLQAHAFTSFDWYSTTSTYSAAPKSQSATIYSTSQSRVNDYTYFTPSDIYFDTYLSGHNVFKRSINNNQAVYTLADQYANLATHNTVRKSRPSSWDEPDAPIGDIPVPLVLAFIATAIIIQRKKQQTAH